MTLVQWNIWMQSNIIEYKSNANMKGILTAKCLFLYNMMCFISHKYNNRYYVWVKWFWHWNVLFIATIASLHINRPIWTYSHNDPITFTIAHFYVTLMHHSLHSSASNFMHFNSLHNILTNLKWETKQQN